MTLLKNQKEVNSGYHKKNTIPVLDVITRYASPSAALASGSTHVFQEPVVLPQSPPHRHPTHPSDQAP